MKVLLAVDGSPHSRAAVDEVARRPWPAGTFVRVISSVELYPPPATDVVLLGGALEDLLKAQTAEAERLVNEVASLLRSKGLEAEGVVRTGDPRVTVVEEAKAWGADLIVVGSHGRTGLARWLLGSVALSIVQHAPCSVLVVRTTAAAERESQSTTATERAHGS